MAFEPKPNTGALFKNDRKTEDKHPGATGNLLVECPHCQSLIDLFLDAWTNTIENGQRAGEKMQKLKVKAKDKQPPPSPMVLASRQRNPPPQPPAARRPPAPPPPDPDLDAPEEDDIPF